MKQAAWTPSRIALALLPAGLLGLLVISVANPRYPEPLFIHTAYYFLLATVLCWAGAYFAAARALRGETLRAWVRENWPGMVLALAVTVVVCCAVPPALRMLSDEAGLVGTSRNLWATKTATYTVSGKYYFDSYWDIDVAVDQRPAMFPFLVSLLHTLFGYSFRNAFHLNLLVLPAFVLVAYRLAKAAGGERFALVAALFAVAHPTTLLAVRSGGFDFLAAFFALLALKSLFDHVRAPSPERLAILWMNLCMFAEVRYESVLFLPPVVALLLGFRLVSWSHLRPFAFLYALTPAFFLPRLWQAIARGSVPEQTPGTVVFSAHHFFNHAGEYLRSIPKAFAAQPAHSGVVIGLGVLGSLLWLAWIVRRLRARDLRDPPFRFAVLLATWIGVQVFLVFTYVWGQAQHPASARLVLAIDTFLAFPAAWVVAQGLRRQRPWVAVLLAAAVVAFALPVASQHRMFNRLTQTRESATTWRYFESLHEKRILIVTDRPSHFTIMGYGAMDFASARRDPVVFDALARGLFYDIYLVQQIDLRTNEPFPAYAIWPTRARQTVLEFQNDAQVKVRISRLAH
jgi:hypothetical protein